MPNQETTISTLLAAADNSSGSIAAAFMQAINALKADLVDMDALEIALQGYDIDAVLAAINADALADLLRGSGLPRGALVLVNEVQAAYNAGVKAAYDILNEKAQKVFSYDYLSERAINNMRAYGADMVKGITNSSKNGIRTIASRFIEDGINPVKASKEIRQLIGLTDAQMQAVYNFRQQLEQRKLLGFTDPSSRRLNAIEQAMVGRHMRTGTFDQAKIDAMVERYYQSLLNKRAIDISRTESLRALHRANTETYIQGIEQGLFDETDRKFWINTHDDRLRETHAAIPLMNPNGVSLTSYFVTPFGMVMSPGDSNINLINCRCVVLIAKAGSTYNQRGYLKYA